MKMTMEDVRNRSIYLATPQKSNDKATLNVESVFQKIQDGHYTYSDTKYVLENWNQLDSSLDNAFMKVFELFETVCDNENSCGKIKSLASIICENTIPKVRSGDQTREFVKRRVARFKTKLHTKFNNNIDNMKDAVGSSVDTLKSNFGANVAAAKTAIKSNVDKSLQREKDDAVKECYDKFDEAISMAEMADTILANQIKLSKRFNFDRIVREYVGFSDDITDCIVEMCNCIDTYNIPMKAKYNVAVQNIPYTLYRNRVGYDMSKLLETVTDYFLIYTDSISESTISDMKSVLERNSKFMDDEDLNGVSYMFGGISKDFKFDDTFSVLQERPNASGVTESTILSAMVESSTENKVSQLINSFKLEAEKTPEKLKNLMLRIYVQSPEQIINDFPNLISWFRTFFIAGGAAAIHPLLGIAALFADLAIKMTVTRKQMSKYVKDYEKEIEKAKSKRDKATNAETKDRLTKYVDQLEKGLQKLKDKEDDLYTDEENIARKPSEIDDDFDFDFSFESMDIIDKQNAAGILAMSEIMSDFDKINPEKVITALEQSIPYIDNESIHNITQIFEEYTDVFDTNRLRVALENEISNLKGRLVISTYIRLNCLTEDIYQLKNLAVTESPVIDNPIVGLCRLSYIHEACIAILDLASTAISSIQEMDMSNSLKLAGENLKRVAKDLSDKEKIASRNIDASMGTFTRSAEKALMNGNREAVIKGSLIPSASKIIKSAIALGVSWAINPALAVIGALGSIALSKRLQAKERQLILDEIEIELDMCKRYLRIAEENNDMKAVKQLLNTQRSLQRQQQRIKYKMSVYHNQPTKVGSGDKDDYMDESALLEDVLSAKQRTSLSNSDYGIPSKRKYPMPDKDHVKAAIKMFNHVDNEDEALLAKNINRKIKEFNMADEVNVGKNNRFEKYWKK